MADIFLSYATADWPRAKVLMDWFERLGWSVFVDRETRHGEPWAEHIEAELKAAKCVVVFWSSAAFESEWVLREAALAHEIKRLVQVKGTGLDAPEPFCTLQMFSFEAWAGENDVPEKQAFLEEVAGRLGRDVPKAEVVKTLAVPPDIHRFESRGPCSITAPPRCSSTSDQLQKLSRQLKASDMLGMS